MKIKTLKITNFRQFPNKDLEFNKNWIILEAPNARGKSTIVEAIFMLASGNSPWTNGNLSLIHIPDRNKTEDEDPKTKVNDGFFRLEASIESKDDFKTISTYVENQNQSTTKQFKIEGTNTNKAKFTDILHCILFSPDMIDFLMFEPKQRRDFIDSHLSHVNPDYSNILSNYNKVLRQRNSFLKAMFSKNGRNGSANGSGKIDETGLRYWTEQLVNLGTQVIMARIEFLDKLNDTKSSLYQSKIVYVPKVKLDSLEELADSTHIRNLFQNQLTLSQRKERIIGNTIVGPHRDDWYLTDEKGQNLNVFGSRGEKRMAIADIIFKINHFMIENIGEPPVILLDDISSELDENNIEILFNKKISKDQQTIITTTNIETIPKEARKLSQIIAL
ncbi:DNA replication and repair protein RecF [Candidatus Dojkabacteria bacterium]|nr:DNA replication and repair protein RecF [Candidatus Dojkabacteria bacterium]